MFGNVTGIISGSLAHVKGGVLPYWVQTNCIAVTFLLFFPFMQAAGVPKHSAEQMQADIDHLKAELGLAE